MWNGSLNPLISYKFSLSLNGAPQVFVILKPPSFLLPEKPDSVCYVPHETGSRRIAGDLMTSPPAWAYPVTQPLRLSVVTSSILSTTRIREPLNNPAALSYKHQCTMYILHHCPNHGLRQRRNRAHFSSWQVVCPRLIPGCAGFWAWSPVSAQPRQDQ